MHQLISMRLVFLFLFSGVLFSIPLKAEKQEYDLNGLNLPTTDLSLLFLFSQQLTPLHGGNSGPASIKNAWGSNIDLDFPIWKNFHPGFYFQFTRGYLDVDPTQQFNLLYNTMGIGIFLKPQFEIPVPYGNLALSLQIPLGYEVPLGLPLNESWSLAKMELILTTPLPQYGFKTGALLGIEYFPIYVLGIFIQGGYQIAYHNFKKIDTTLNLNSNNFIRKDVGTVDYLLRGAILKFGIKIAY